MPPSAGACGGEDTVGGPSERVYTPLSHERRKGASGGIHAWREVVRPRCTHARRDRHRVAAPSPIRSGPRP